MIRKESLVNSNDLVGRRIGRSFQRVMQFKNSGREKELLKEYQTDRCEIRRDFQRVHELYNRGSKMQQIREKKIEKMKNRIQKSKRQVNRDEMILVREVDLTKLYSKQVSKSKHQAQSSSTS